MRERQALASLLDHSLSSGFSLQEREPRQTCAEKNKLGGAPGRTRTCGLLLRSDTAQAGIEHYCLVLFLLV